MEIQLFFSNSMLPAIAWKRWNFPECLDFKDKTVAKFLVRSHFLSISNNMTVKQHVNHGAIQKVCHLRNGIFHSSNLCQVCMAVSAYIATAEGVENSAFRFDLHFKYLIYFQEIWAYFSPEWKLIGTKDYRRFKIIISDETVGFFY